jgi:hypothetical protein
MLAHFVVADERVQVDVVTQPSKVECLARASRANSLVRLFREHRMCMWLRKMIDVNNGVPARSTDHEHSHGMQRAAS